MLGRYGRRVEAAIARCHELLDGIDDSDPRAVEAYAAARRAAVQAIDDFCFQREMLRLFGHARVHEVYRVPPPLGDREAGRVVE